MLTCATQPASPPTTCTGGSGGVASSSEPTVVMFSMSAPNGEHMMM